MGPLPVRRRVLVIDDHQVARFAARSMLQSIDGVEWVGEAASGSEGVTAAALLRPDVVILDVEMPGLDGPQTAARILETRPSTIILGWTVSEDSTNLLRMINAGSAGYLLKEAGPREFAQAIETALRGELPIPRRLMTDIVRDAARRVSPPSPSSTVRLTPAEMRVLRRLGMGDSVKMVARALGVSVSSVDTHLRSIYRKLQATNRAQAVTNAIRFGVISPEEFDS